MSKKSNLHIGSVGGNFNVRGDIVAGDKITTSQTTTTTINYGFEKEKDKAEFVSQVDELLSMMHQMRSQISEIKELGTNKREEILAEISEQSEALEKAKAEAVTVPVGQKASKDKAKTIEGCLDKATTFIEKIQKMGEKTTEFANKIIPFVSKVLPILINIRKLFGLP